MSLVNFRALNDLSYWHALAPDLTVGETAKPPTPQVDTDLQSIADDLRVHGYFRVAPVFHEAEMVPLRNALDALRAAQLPPVFIYVFDQPWALFRKLSPLIQYFLSEQFALLPNFWAWNIPLESGSRGWPPHQDCQAATRFSSGDDQVLMSLSLWIPLSDATIHNGCMSVLPRHLSDQVTREGTIPDQVMAQAVDLPASSASVLGWTQDLYHWSNHVTDQAERPRMSLSLEFQNPAFAPLAEPLLDLSQTPSFTERLDLITRQIPKYAHMESLKYHTS